jgi:hypothetical protein
MGVAATQKGKPLALSGQQQASTTTLDTNIEASTGAVPKEADPRPKRGGSKRHEVDPKVNQ